MRALLLALALALAAIAPAPVLAVMPDEVLSDPTLEARARDISKELRCMVCQNQSIDDSDAPLARDLRILVRERLEAGDSDAEVRDFVVERYGEFVLLKPRFLGHTLLLWLSPVILLVLGGLLAWRVQRRHRPGDQVAPDRLTAAEKRRIARLLSDK